MDAAKLAETHNSALQEQYDPVQDMNKAKAELVFRMSMCRVSCE